MWQLAPTSSDSLVNSMKIVQNPVATCDRVYALIQSLTSQIRKRMEDPKSAGEQNPFVNLPLTDSTQICLVWSGQILRFTFFVSPRLDEFYFICVSQGTETWH